MVKKMVMTSEGQGTTGIGGRNFHDSSIPPVKSGVINMFGCNTAKRPRIAHAVAARESRHHRHIVVDQMRRRVYGGCSVTDVNPMESTREEIGHPPVVLGVKRVVEA